MPLNEIDEESSFKGGIGKNDGGLLRHNSAPLQGIGGGSLIEKKGPRKGSPGGKLEADPTVLAKGGSVTKTIEGHPSPLPPPAPLQAANLTESQLIGTVEVRDSVAAAQERKLKGLSLSKNGDIDLIEGGFKHLETYDWEIDPKKLVLKNFIAKGTYGTVHRGCYDGKDVAVKLLDWGEDSPADRAELTEVRKAFIQEVTVWSKLNHKNVTQFIGALLGGRQGFKIPSYVTDHDGHMLVEGHVSCVVLEYLPGGTLKKLILAHKSKKLPLKTVIQLALDIARGLAYLHSKHIVHRDVKSENMLLDRHKVVKIADFGVSRVEEDSHKHLHQLAGTYGYMAPEVLKGIPYNHKVDVYSFGILLWEIYCCDNPFPFLNFNPEDIKCFVTQGLRPQLPSCCPADLAGIMTQCWDQDPDKRPNMGEVVQLLEKVDVHHGKGMAHDDMNTMLPHHEGAVLKVLHKLKGKITHVES